MTIEWKQFNAGFGATTYHAAEHFGKKYTLTVNASNAAVSWGLGRRDRWTGEVMPAPAPVKVEIALSCDGERVNVGEHNATDVATARDHATRIILANQ